MTQHMSGTWKAIDIEIYEIDDLGNPGNFLAMARDQRVAARMADMHNSMLAALTRLVASCEKLPAFTNPDNLLSIDRLNTARAAIAKAERTKP